MISSRWLLGAALLAPIVVLTACSSSGGSASIGAQPPQYHWVVSLGDSYISGEGTRWAGNTDGAPDPVDAQGPFAYGAANGLEAIPGCHRARQSEIDVNYGSVRGDDLACSGAQTSTFFEGTVFKPGIDFYDQNGHLGQALQLENFAKSHNVTAVVLGIGGNDFEFSTIVTDCVEDFVGTAGSKPSYCSQDPTLKALFTPAHVATVQKEIEQSITNITTALSKAGEKPGAYRIVVQDYPSPLPPGNLIRYPQTVAARFTDGGCPLYNKDADWANTTVLPTINSTVKAAVQASGVSGITFLDLSQAFVGHRLCEQGVNQFQNAGLTSWKSPGAANALEWVNQVYVKGIPWQSQESAHPNFWGMEAERNCLRQVLESAAAPSESCSRSGTSMHGYEPVMTVSR